MNILVLGLLILMTLSGNSLKLESLSPDSLRTATEIVQELRYRANFERLWDWRPADQQKPAYVSDADEVWCFGGNRSGKSELVCTVLAQFAWGVHPIRSEIKKPPVFIRHCATDWQHGVGTLLKKYQQLIPRAWIKKHSWSDAWKESQKALSFENGSVITFRAFEQDVNKFGADDLDAVGQDEHGPEPYYIENKMRLADRNGFLMAAMTPEFGITWEEEHVTNPPEGLKVEHFFFATADNPHLSKKGVAQVQATIRDPKLADAKLKGLFVPLTGLVIPSWNHRLSIIPDRPLHEQAVRVFCIDCHLKTPSAALWGAWEPSEGRDGFDFVVYRTMKRLATVNEWKQAIVAIESGEKIESRLGDESERDTGVTGIYDQTSILAAFNRGDDNCSIILPIQQVPKPAGSFEGGVLKLRDWCAPDKTGQPRIKVFESCNHGVEYINGKPCGSLPWELKRYSFKKEQKADEETLREKVRKVDDHLIDCVRYLIMQGPVAVHDDQSGPIIIRGSKRVV